MGLTIEQEHLLKRELLRLQVGEETEVIDNLINLQLIGPPFLTKEGLYDDGAKLPIFRFVYTNFLHSFPLFSQADDHFWVEVCQPFVQGLASKDISSSADRDEATKRRRIGRAFKRMAIMLLVAGLGSNTAKPATGRYKLPPRYANKVQDASNGGMVPMDEGESYAQTEEAIQKGEAPPMAPPDQVGPRASAIGVRIVTSNKMFKSKETQFIIEAQLWGAAPVWVGRTYADFVALDKKLVKAFPGKALATLPMKNSKDTILALNGEKILLPRERQRTTLRFYLFKLCSNPKIANSEPFLEFLFKDRVSELSASEIKDIEARISLDKQRWTDREKFVELANERSKKLEGYLKEIKNEILVEDALPRIFFEMRNHDKVEDMSPLLQKLVEYCLVEIAALIYHMLIARDDSPEIFSQVKRLHRLVPYRVIQGILMLSNPVVILKKMTDLFMSAPFGGNSLLQTMFIRILSDDVRSQEKLIEELRHHINDKDIYDAIYKYAWSGHYEREAIHTASDASGHDLVLVIFESSSLISSNTLGKVRKAHEVWQKAVRGLGPDDLPEVEYYSALKDLLRHMVRQRDKEILKQFWGEPMTMKFIRSIVNMTYDVLIEIFRTANVSESVGDLEKFMTDLVELIDHIDGGMALDANQMVDSLISLLRKHQNSFFRFVNRVYSKDDGIFVALIAWMTRAVNFVRAGKEGRHMLDLLGLADNAAANGTINMSELQSDLDKLDAWLKLRKQTAVEKGELTNDQELDGGYAGGFDVADIGLTWDDVDYGLAEVERDEQEEFLPTVYEDLSQDAVVREKFRREKLEEIQQRRQQLPPRPESAAIAKLLPQFHKMLAKVLETSDAAPSKLNMEVLSRTKSKSKK